MDNWLITIQGPTVTDLHTTIEAYSSVRRAERRASNPHIIEDWGFEAHKQRIVETLRCLVYHFGFIFIIPEHKNSNISKQILRLETLVVFQIQDYGDLTTRE